MANCVHCNKNGIDWFSKLWGDSSAPAQCHKCNEFSHIPVSVFTKIRLYNFIVMVSLLFCSYYFVTLIPVGAYIIYHIGIYTYVVRTTDMVGISKVEASENKKKSYLFLIASAVIAILLYISIDLIK